MSKFHCARCGTCCRKGGPGLHTDDADLVVHLGLTNIVCLRRGELAFDPQTNTVQPLLEELLKIRGKGMGWKCIFFDADKGGCSVYAHRPLECSVLQCDNTKEIFHALALPRLTRAHLVDAQSALGECIAEHERLFPMQDAVELARQKEHSAKIKLEDMVRQELFFRQAFARRVQATDEQLWLYFGRPLELVLLPLRSGSQPYPFGCAQLRSGSSTPLGMI